LRGMRMRTTVELFRSGSICRIVPAWHA